MTDAEQLAAAESAFERGDFAAVRTLTEGLATSLDPDLRKKAVALRKRVAIDPVAVVVLVFCALFFVAVCVRYFGAR